MKLLVCGGRDFTDYDLFFKHIDYICKTNYIETIIEGGASGADQLAEQYAVGKGIEHIKVKAEWDKYGRSAGPIRNTQMLKMLEPNDKVLAFWDGSSRGTSNMIKQAQGANLDVIVVKYIN